MLGLKPIQLLPARERVAAALRKAIISQQTGSVSDVPGKSDYGENKYLSLLSNKKRIQY